MATVDECRAALEQLSEQLEQNPSAQSLDRTLSCQLTDLDVTFRGRLHGGRIDALTTEPGEKAQIRLAMTSDDLLRLVAGELNFASAWAKGQLKLEASMMDMIRLRSMF